MKLTFLLAGCLLFGSAAMNATTPAGFAMPGKVVTQLSTAKTAPAEKAGLHGLKASDSGDDSDWSSWIDLGTVDVTYSKAIYQNTNSGLTLSMRASLSATDHLQYKIDGYLLTNVEGEEARPLIIDIIGGQVYVYSQELPKLTVKNADGTPFEGKLFVADIATYFEYEDYRILNKYSDNPYSFELWLAYYDGEGNLLGDGENFLETVKFNLPDAIKVPLFQTVGGNSGMGFLPVTTGESVNMLTYAIAKGSGADASGKSIEERVAANDETLTIMTQMAGQPMLTFSDGPGRYTIGLAAYDIDGNLLSTASCPVYNMPEDSWDWESVGDCLITDAFLPDVYGHEPTPYRVKVEKSLSTEGLYRVTDIYGATHPYAATIQERTVDFPVYTYFHCEDADACYISESPTGVIFDPSGEVFITSTAEYYALQMGIYTADLKEMGFESYGNLANGVITFPTGSLMATSTLLLENGYGWLEVGSSNALTLDLNSATSAIESITGSVDESPTRYFNLQGIEVASPESGSLYIKRQGGHSEKIIY